MRKNLALFPAQYCHGSQANWFEIQEGLDAGKSLFYLDFQNRPGKAQATVVFVHGNPESSYTYRHIIEHLRSSEHSIRIVADGVFALEEQREPLLQQCLELGFDLIVFNLVRWIDKNQIVFC